MAVSPQTYELLALEDSSEHWELHNGCLRRKPGMITEHNDIARWLARRLSLQLDESEFSVDMNTTRLRISTGTFYIPDITVIPRVHVRRAREQRGRQLEVYEEPMPLVVEIWSPSTGEYDVETKLLEYQWRGDIEIWRVHPYERTITAWRRQVAGGYIEAIHVSGVIGAIALPAMHIDLDALFAR